MKPWTETTVVGKPLPRVDAYERVSGAAVYTVDVSFPDMLHLAILRCPHAHALVKKVDAQVARTMPGVHAVLTHADPEANVVLPYPSWIANGPPMRLLDPHCRYAGEEVAAVAAETPEQAREALRAIVVEYEELPFVLDATEAVKPGAPAVHEPGNVVGPPRSSSAATWPRDCGRRTPSSRRPTRPPARSTPRWRRSARWRGGTATG